MEKFTFFWKGPFSQWWTSRFTHDGITYNCAEQWMMYQKAMFFGDEEIAQEILETSHPRDQQALGRRVSNFNQRDWDANARTFVYLGNLYKFQQNPKLWEKLKETVGTTMVEASAIDKVWGIGLTEDNPLALDREKWRGKNWLGECITRVREDLLNDS